MLISSLKPKWCLVLNISQMRTVQHWEMRRKCLPQEKVDNFNRRKHSPVIFLGFSFLWPYQHFPQWNHRKMVRGDKTMWSKRTVRCIYYFTEQRMLAKGTHYSLKKAAEGILTWKHLSKTTWHFWGKINYPDQKKKD